MLGVTREGTRDAHLCTRACQVRTEHDHPWCSIGELLSAGLEAILKEFQITATAVAAFLIFDFVLNDERLGLEVNGLRECSRDGVVGSWVLDNQTLVALNGLEDGGLLNSPLTNVSPVLFRLGVLLLRV